MAMDTAQVRATAVGQAAGVVGTLKTIAHSIQRLEQARALYAAGTDPVFNAAFNALFDMSDRAEISAMITQLKTLRDDWSLNHDWVVS